MFYRNTASTSDFFVRDNIFANATDSALRLSNQWNVGPTMDDNCWFQSRGLLMVCQKTQFTPSQFADYQKQTGLDTHSRLADPRFVNAAKLDFRPGADIGPAGAQRRLQD